MTIWNILEQILLIVHVVSFYRQNFLKGLPDGKKEKRG